MGVHGMKWIAAAYDSAPGYALGDSEYEAQEAYIARFGEPRYGFYVIRNRADYTAGLRQVAERMGFADEGSIPLVMADRWIVVARLTDAAVDALEGCEKPGHLLNDWRTDEFFIDAPPPRRRYISRFDAHPRQQIDVEDGMAPSERQREAALAAPWDWADRMAWSHERGEIELTHDEIAYAQAIYKARGATPAIVQSVYRW